MHLKEISVSRYGPLSGILLQLDRGFNVVYGPNESGKTLLVDAIIRMLVEKAGSAFEPELLGRVAAEPAGYILIEDAAGADHKIPEQVTLTGLLGTRPEDLRNVFVVRSSDLLTSGDADYLKDVQDRLTGLETSTIEALKTGIRDWAQITERRGDLINTADNLKLRERYGGAGRLVVRITDYINAAADEGLDETEAHLFRARMELGRVTAQAREQAAARDRDAIRHNRGLLARYRELRARLDELKPYTQQAIRSLDGVLGEVRLVEGNLATAGQDLARGEEELRRAGDRLSEARARLAAGNQAQEAIRPLSDDLRDWMRRSGERAQRQREWRAGARSAMAAVLSGGVLGLAALIVDQPWWVSAALLAAGGVVGLVFHNQGRLAGQQVAAVDAEWETLAYRAAQAGLEGSTVDEITASIGRSMKELSDREAVVEERQREVMAATAAVKNLQQSIEQLAGRRESHREEARALERRLKVSGRDEMDEMCERRQDAEQRLGETAALLTDRLGSPGQGGDSPELFWSREIDRADRGATGVQDEVEFDAALLADLRSRGTDLQDTIESLSDQLVQHSRHLEALERETREILLDDCPPIANLDGARIAAVRLRDFVSATARTQDDARAMIGILDRIQGEEETKVADLLGEESPATSHFTSFTSGRYSEVFFDPSARRVMVRTAAGRVLGVEHLSKGSVDQLYMSIRLSLADRLLDGQPGFLVLDDPFLASDGGRLRRQMEALRDLSQRGYTLLYFTAKDEVVDLARTMDARIKTMERLDEQV